MSPKRFLILFLAAFILLGVSQASSQPGSNGQTASDLVHSDLPLFGGDSIANIWPRPFHDEDSFGCISRVVFGDWVLREVGTEGDEESEWYRIRNYGVFHCWALVGRAYHKAALDGVELKPGFFVFLGTAKIENVETELWAIQIGAIPGSDYLLLSRPPNEGRIETFSVLQTQCPKANVRDVGSLDIILTRYCAINTQAGLLRLARRMAQRSPLGTLYLVQSKGDDGEASE